MHNQDDLICSYVTNTKYYDHLRAQLHGYLSAKQLKQLLEGLHSLARYRDDTIVCAFTGEVVVVVVYGELLLRGATTRKGEYFRVADGEQLQMQFVKATTLLVINAELLERRISNILELREKVKIVQKCMPVSQLKLTQSQVRKIAKALQLQQVSGKYCQLSTDPGIYLLHEGIFHLCYKRTPFLEMQNNFIEFKPQHEYSLKLVSCQGKYCYVERDSLYEILSAESILELDRLSRHKLETRANVDIKVQYFVDAQKLREKIGRKYREARKRNGTLSEKQMQSLNCTMAVSRKTMLQKCSTTTMVSKSAGKTSRRAKSEAGYRTFRTEPAEGKNSKEELKLQLTEEKLNKMRSIQKAKDKLSLQKNWYYLNPEKTSRTVQETYWKIKKSENPREAKVLCNYKRVHRIFSDPYFRKALNFRNL